MSDETELFEKALALKEDDRAELASQLIRSLKIGEKDPGYDDAWAEEIERRLLDLEEGRAELVSWDEVKERILKTLDRIRSTQHF